MSAAAKGEELKVMLPMMMNKLYSTDTMQMLYKLAYDLLGADGMLAPNEEDVAGYARTNTITGFVEQYMYSLGPAIAGGATNIQLNIIGERGLGLPRDLRPPWGPPSSAACCSRCSIGSCWKAQGGKPGTWTFHPVRWQVEG